MYNHSFIRSCFSGLLGFDQSYNSAHPVLDSDLTASASGMYVNSSLHPLITPDNILAVVEQFNKVPVRVYHAGVNYRKNDIVKSGSDIYQSVVDDNSGNVLTDVTKWKKTNLYSAFLRKTYDGAVLKLFNQVFTEKKLNEVAKTLLSGVHLFEGVGNISGRITKQDRLVGYKIRVKNPDTIAILTTIGLQLDTAQALNLYLYHTSSNVPVRIFALNHTRSIQYQWHSVTQEVLAFMDGNINADGAYYLCYYEDDLTGSAIKKDQYSFDGVFTSCSTCVDGIKNAQLFNQRTRFIDVQPYYVNEGYYEKGELWEEENEFHVVDTNFGINLQLSVQCDVSNFLCQHKNVFVNAIAQALVVDLLQEMNFSTRDNQLQGKLGTLAAAALDNQENGQYGEVKKLTKAVAAISLDLTSVNKNCAPCVGKVGRVSSVWS